MIVASMNLIRSGYYQRLKSIWMLTLKKFNLKKKKTKTKKNLKLKRILTRKINHQEADRKIIWMIIENKLIKT